MIYVIGGPPRTGKTILAAALAQRTSCPYFSIDHIAQVIVPYIPEQDYAVRLPLRVARQKTHYSNDWFYEQYSPEQSVNLYLRQAETYWPGVENFINYALEDDHDLIIEGWQILPNRLRRVIAADTRAARIVFLYKRSEFEIAAGLRSHVAKNDWVIKNTEREDTFDAIAKMIGLFGVVIEREAASSDFRAVNTDREFETTIEQVLEFLLT
jgi:2-phosphoglycerate kinase